MLQAGIETSPGRFTYGKTVSVAKQTSITGQLLIPDP
jgi:hypothetical protein